METQLYNGDCLEIMPWLSPNSVDLVLTDPPYSSGGLFAGDRKRSTTDKYTDTDYNGASRFSDFSGDNMDQRSFTWFLRETLSRARMVTKPGGVCGVFTDWRQLPSVSDALQAGGWVWRGIVVWDKGNSRAVPFRYRNDCEFLVWGTNGPRSAKMVPGVKTYPGCYHVPIVQSKDKHHQAEKPVALLESLVQICPEGGTVFDPFMGSGSTGVACLNTGRNFIGIELDPGYFEVAKDRIEAAKQEKEETK